MSRAHKHSRAVRDLLDLAEYIRQDSPRAALRFLSATERTFAELARHPGMGVAYEAEGAEGAGLRRFPVSGFERYLVFYRPTADGIEVVRVLHGARRIAAVLEDLG